MKFKVAQRLFLFIEQYGLEAGVQAFYADQGISAKSGQAIYPDVTIVEDGSTTFYAVSSTPITAVS
jgi:hypothetical protein